MIIIRKWQVEACDNNHCAAAMLSIFEYWHNYKLDSQKVNKRMNEVALNHGEEAVHDESLYQFHNTEDLIDNLLGLYRKDSINRAIDLLVQKKFVSVHRNPNPKYRFDATRHFLLLTENIKEWLKDYDDTKNRVSPSENRRRSAEKRKRSSENRSAIPETSSETSSENNSPAGECGIDGNGKDGGEGKEAGSDQGLDPQGKRGAPSDSQPPSSAQPPSLHKKFIALYCELYKERTGKNYLVQGGKDGKAAQKLVAGLKDDALAALREAHAKYPLLNDFFKDKVDSIAGFASKINEIRAFKESKPVWIQRLEIKEQLRKHPANPDSAAYNYNPTQEQKDDLEAKYKRYEAVGGKRGDLYD